MIHYTFCTGTKLTLSVMVPSLSAKKGGMAQERHSQYNEMQLLHVQKTSYCFLLLAPGVSRTNRATRKKPNLLKSRANKMMESGKTIQETRQCDAATQKTHKKV